MDSDSDTLATELCTSTTGRRVVVLEIEDERVCQACGVRACIKPYDLRESRIKDLEFRAPAVAGGLTQAPLPVPGRSARGVFTENSEQILARHRLRSAAGPLETAASGSARSRADVAREHPASDWSVQVVGGQGDLGSWPNRIPARRPGLDETRTRSVR